jgi:beta-glucanase (GH16 family)
MKELDNNPTNFNKDTMNNIEDNRNSISVNNEVIFFDDFSSEKLDRSKWNVEITGKTVNNEQQAYVDSPETIYINQGYPETSYGTLVIHPRYQQGYTTQEGRSFDFISGRINTRNKMEFTFGCVSARILLPSGTGLWPAFWALGTSGHWPTCGELDVMENVGEWDWSSVAVHGPGYSGETPLVNKKYFLPNNFTTNWHIYTLECNETTGLIFKIDGELIYRVTRPMVEYYGSWVFSDPKYLILNFALGGTYPFKTNGVHSPYYGIPEKTVLSIQNNDTKMLVDWVKVTRLK